MSTTTRPPASVNEARAAVSSLPLTACSPITSTVRAGLPPGAESLSSFVNFTPAFRSTNSALPEGSKSKTCAILRGAGGTVSGQTSMSRSLP